MAFIDQYKLLKDGDFQGRIWIAVLTAAELIAQEEGYDPTAPVSARHALAARVLMENDTSLNLFVLTCSLNVAIAEAEAAQSGSSKDGDIQYVVNSNWDTTAQRVAPVN